MLGLHPLFQEGHSCQSLPQGEALSLSPGKAQVLVSRTFTVLVPHFMLNETQQSLHGGGGPVKMKLFFPLACSCRQVGAAVGLSLIPFDICTARRSLHCACTLNLPCVLPYAVAAQSLCTPKESGSPLGRLPLMWGPPGDTGKTRLGLYLGKQTKRKRKKKSQTAPNLRCGLSN